MKEVASSPNIGTPQEWSRRIQDIRLIQRMTQTELAQRAGVAVTTVYRAEQGLPVRQSSLQKIAAAVDVKFDQFLRSGPLLHREDLSYVHHRAEEAVWYAPVDHRRILPEDNDRLVQSPAERKRLGILGLTPIFVCYPNLLMPEGPGATLIELYGRYNRPFNPTIYRECLVYGQRGRARLQVLDDVVELAEGDIAGFVSKNLRWIEPAEPSPSDDPPLVLWVGAVRLGKVAVPTGKRTIVRRSKQPAKD